MADTSSPAGVTRRLSTFDQFTTLYVQQLRQLVTSRKTIGLALLNAGLLVIAVIALATNEYLDGLSLFRTLSESIMLPFVVPLVALFYGGPAIVDEMEERTLTYLMLRPIPKPALYLGKVLSAITIGTLMVGVSSVCLFLVCTITGDDPGATFTLMLRVAGSGVFGVFVYSAIFGALGTAFSSSLIAGIVYFVVVETVIARIPVIKLVHMRLYLRTIANFSEPEPEAQGLMAMVVSASYTPPLWMSLTLPLLVGFAALVAGAMIFANRQYNV